MNVNHQEASLLHTDEGTEYRQDESHPFISITCCNCGHTIRVPSYCGNRFCPTCSYTRRSRARTRLRLFLHQLVLNKGERLVHLVLTLKNQHDAANMCTYAIASFRRLRQRKFWQAKVSGGLSVIEITGSEGDWHVHLHLLIQAKYMPQSVLLSLWRHIVGKGGVYIKAASKDQCVNYLTKYLTKSGDEESTEVAARALSGFRLFQPFGAWHGNIPPAPKISTPCKKCGCTAWLPENAILYEWKSIIRPSFPDG